MDREDYILRWQVSFDAEDLFRPHAGFEHQGGHVGQHGCCCGEIPGLLVVGEHACLLVVVGKLSGGVLANGIFEWHIILEHVLEHGAQTGQLEVHPGRLDLPFAGPVFVLV